MGEHSPILRGSMLSCKAGILTASRMALTAPTTPTHDTLTVHETSTVTQSEVSQAIKSSAIVLVKLSRINKGQH